MNKLAVLEYAMKVVAVVVIVFGTISAGLVLLMSAPGMMAAFVVAFASVAAVSAGATLLAIDCLYPEAGVLSCFVDLLWLVVPACLGSVVVFDFLLEGGLLAPLKRTGVGLPRIWAIEDFLGGLFLALALVVTARFLPGTELSPVAALAAGLISAFVRYYLGLWLSETDLEDGLTVDSEGETDMGAQ
ncbi:hypothetical protein BH24ACT18_BH24ACT18_21110 [soil metagenome]